AVTLETPGAGGGPANGESFNPDISGNGRYIVFQSTAGNLTNIELASGVPRVYWRAPWNGVYTAARRGQSSPGVGASAQTQARFPRGRRRKKGLGGASPLNVVSPERGDQGRRSAAFLATTFSDSSALPGRLS